MDATAEIIQDYRLIRGIGLALAALAFLIGLAKLGSTEMPHEHSRAQGLVVKAALVFLLLAGDRMLVHGVAGWFGLSTAGLPVFWQ